MIAFQMPQNIELKNNCHTILTHRNVSFTHIGVNLDNMGGKSGQQGGKSGQQGGKSGQKGGKFVHKVGKSGKYYKTNFGKLWTWLKKLVQTS